MNVLIIDDDQGVCSVLSMLVNNINANPTCAGSVESGLQAARTNIFDIVLLDVNLPDGNGLEILPKLKQLSSQPEIIIMTGLGDADSAELAIKNGAWDYIEKPSSSKEMTLPLMRAIQFRQERKKVQEQPIALKRCGIVGNGQLMMACMDKLAQAAASDTNLLITGQTGTGKELISMAAHQNSRRKANNYVVVDCAALPENLVESTLFGHLKGAFTGASTPTDGLLKHAHGGTLVLDEIGELPLSIQSSFLRVLQEKRFRPVGGTRELHSDFRLISATNRDLDQMVSEGGFRSDLLFRIRAFSIHLPPLRERREDIQDLIMYHLSQICDRLGFAPKGFSPELLETLMAYDWPGNVRELVQALEGAIAAAKFEPTLFPQHLPSYIRVQLARRQPFKKDTPKEKPASGPRFTKDSDFPTLKAMRERAIEQFEHQYLIELKSHCRGDTKMLMRISGVGKSRLYELFKKYDIPTG